MALRMGPTFVAGLVEGGNLLMNEHQRRKAMASKYALLNMEKKLIAQRDLLAHGYRMEQLRKAHEQRMAEIAAMNAWRNQPKQMTEEERAWWEARAEKEQSQADRYRRMNHEDEDRARKQLEDDVKYLDKRMGDITYTTKGEMGEKPKRAVYSEHGMEYSRMAEERDAKLVQLGRMTKEQFDSKWTVTSKPNPVDLGLIPAGMVGTGGRYDAGPGSGIAGQGSRVQGAGGIQQNNNDPLGIR